MRSAALVYNPAAGRGGDDLDELRAALEPHFELRVFEVGSSRGAAECARAALADRPDLVIAAGGDGTVSRVAGALVGGAVPLAILPRGTANSVAASFGIPSDATRALETIVAGAPRRIDTARANGRPMMLHASVGFHAATIGETTREAKNRWGVLAYVKRGLVSLAKLEPFDVEIETERAVVRCRATNVTIANVAPSRAILSHGPALLSPDDGELDVTILAAAGLAEAVVTGLHLLRTALEGEAASRDDVGYFPARRARVTTSPPQPLLVDGERAGEGELVVECVPRSLDVIVPPELARAEPSTGRRSKLTGLPELEVEPQRQARRRS